MILVKYTKKFDTKAVKAVDKLLVKKGLKFDENFDGDYEFGWCGELILSKKDTWMSVEQDIRKMFPNLKVEER